MSASSAEFFPPPEEAIRLLEAGLWPEGQQANLQHRRIAGEDVNRLLPGEDAIFLYPLPWCRFIDDHVHHLKDGKPTTEWAAAVDRSLTQIDAARALVIADFGPGSDAAIVLDYRENILEPTVWGMRYGEGSPEVPFDIHWEILAFSFSQFVQALRLWDLPPFKAR